eukprot:2693641-Rhodomonas_salina.1
MSGTDKAYAAIVLRPHYAMSGVPPPYASEARSSRRSPSKSTMRLRVRPYWGGTMRMPVLIGCVAVRGRQYCEGDMVLPNAVLSP